jgi:transitional endoplasmic reticulum ATPase
MDGLKSRGNVIVIAATNRPNSIDPALRRPGRFDREISISAPNQKGRLNILKIHTRNMPLTDDVKLTKLSELTHGFVGADVSALAKEAAMNVLRRLLPDIKLREKEPINSKMLEKLVVTAKDFEEALKMVRPSAMREILVEIPNVKWDNIGGLKETKQSIIEAVEWPLKHPKAFKNLGVKPPRGILLYGPPGCGKTLLAKAVANESEANFILVKGPELLNKFVGESEKGIRKIFEKARQLTPAIIFFDEIDALVPRRTGKDSTGVSERMVNTLLSELDGLEELQDVIVLAATNRPDILDPALLRPGRFDRMVMVPVPDEKSRLNIFEISKKDMKLASDVDFVKLAKETELFTGADIENVCKEAGLLALRENLEAKEVTMEHFEAVMKKARSSVTEQDIEAYKLLEERFFKSARAGKIRKEVPTYFG